MSNKPKVICIGWHKTGTSTIGDALLALGYTVVGAREDLAHSLLDGNIQPAIQVAAQYDALQDVPWAALYKELDTAFPNSKFILTERESQKWIHSASRHFGATYIKLHKWLYGHGVLRGNEKTYLERYQAHNQSVKEYFKNRPDDLLIINLENNEGWDTLCPFLGADIPKTSFPHSNKGTHSLTAKDKAVRFAKSLIPVFIRRWRVELMIKMGKPDPRNRFNNAAENERERLNRRQKAS